MQYYQAVRLGEAEALRSQSLLAKYTGMAVAAMIVKETSGGWAPVGVENFYAVVNKDENLCLLVLCDGDGYVKAMSNTMPCRVAESLAAKMESDGLRRFLGRLTLPL
ncbi:MAG: hypothetical protein QXS57_02865 [Candidatus Caldarchaeum sp.]|uniref:Uncharacterized protein n=1 Tax=Caldiarchaeum subterraneum TaxID=311458 RepID=A0A7J3VSH8_CALS0